MGNKNMEVVVVDPIEKFANTLGTHQDSTCLRGKLLVSVNITSVTPVALLTLSPSFFGARATSLASIFANFRFKRLVIKYNYAAPSGINTVGVLGILVDASGAEGDAPSSASGLLEFRTSATNYNQQQPTVVEWAPTDARFWYKTFSGATGSDPRFVDTAVIYVANLNSANSTHIAEIDYSIVFKGALDTGSTVSLRPPLACDEDGVLVHQAPGVVTIPKVDPIRSYSVARVR
jgi:hypothetical protein